MLEYIRKQLAAKAEAAVQESASVDAANVSDELLLEYAPVMSGLDDLTMNGDGTDNVDRPVIAIPLESEDDDVPDIAGLTDNKANFENDPELGSVTLDLTSGNMMDVPMDANIQTEYAEMKTFDTFLMEGYEAIDPQQGQTVEEYDAVVMESAKKNFRTYRDEVLNEQSFGFSKVSMHDESIKPAFIAEFDTNVSTMIEPKYQVDKFGNVRNKQVESVDIMNKYGVLKKLGTFLESTIEGFNKESDNVWSNMFPVSMNVPIDPIDKHSVIVGLKNMKDMSTKYIRCLVPVMESYVAPTFEEVPSETIEKMNKVSASKSQIVQEAIDFGNTDAAATPAPEAAPAPEATPAATDASADAALPDMPTEGAAPDATAQGATDATAATPAEGEDKTVIPVETNNVSDQIAQKVATDTEVPTEAQNGDETAANIADAGATADELPTPPSEGVDPALDAGATDMGLNDPSAGDTSDLSGSDINVGVGDNDPSLDGDSAGDIDAQLNDLDQMGATNSDEGMDAAIGGEDAGDVGNMSMDELLQAASDKLKGMPINALQKFLTGDAEALQEAFVQEFVTNKNVNDQLNANLRKCLGILNDEELSFKGIENQFKKSGKQLNSILSKASKNAKVYDDSERKELTDLNSTLTDLMVHFKPSKKEDVESTKKKIVAFTSQATKVDKIITKHKGKASEDNEDGKE